ncbi:MASE1 domain-containing protein [Fulvimonas yonginensis]|uniref:MASE1 domain-containing protein n=1 Tax=Fulvimonas yonginensis TaxID=1495200 RepID=A0ABU8J7Y3_9GAMM
MLKRVWDNVWGQRVIVALGYAAAYGLLREVSISQWMLFSGFRLCVLILVPYRYWPALVAGELVPLTVLGIRDGDQFGWLWSASMLLPPIMLAMPIVRFFREQRRLFPTRTTTSMSALLLCAFLVSFVWAALNYGTFSLITLPPGYHFKAVGAQYFLGNYITVLTVVPLALAVREELLSRPIRQFWSNFAGSRLVLEAVSLLLPSLALLVWLASGATGDASQAARMAMFFPVAWLSLRHGWRGAAVGGTAASIAVMLTMPDRHDENTMQAEAFIAFAVTTMLLFGARIAALHRSKEQKHMDARLALAVAQRNVYLGELQLRETSRALEEMSAAIQTSYTQLLGRTRSLLPGTDERNYYRDAIVAQHQIRRLADSLHPLAWRERGLPAALQDGAIPGALDEAGLVYWCDIQGKGLDQLSMGVQMTLYRLALEAIAYTCAKRNVSTVRLRLRGGTFRGRRWAVLCVDGEVDYERLAHVRWDEVSSALGCGGLDLGAIKDRALIFEGRVHVRSLANGNRISMIVFEPAAA